MNTLIEYLYRDASNYKKWTRVVLPGELVEDEIDNIFECCARDPRGGNAGCYFCPDQVGLPDDCRYSDDDAEHDYFELFNIDSTDEEPTMKTLSAMELFDNFRTNRHNWRDTPS